MINKFFLLGCLCLYISAAEVSMFDAGDINIAKPYGLTKAEQVSYDNKQKLDILNKKLNTLKSNFNDINEKIEGISSVYESDSETLNKAKRTLSNTALTIKDLKELSITNSESIINLEKKLDSFISTQTRNNQKLEKTLFKMVSLVNKINQNYVTTNQFDELVKFVNNGKLITTKPKPRKTLSNSSKLIKAISMVNRRYFTKSLPLWNELLKANYKPATVNFYLGEVRFGKKQYEKAIHHYKTSMLLYDEASYIPTLLLHSAISFEKIRDKENAMNFYSTLVDTYPSSKEAIKAQKQLNKLK
jgi:tetratricopeptide (TPR) repeat protein